MTYLCCDEKLKKAAWSSVDKKNKLMTKTARLGKVGGIKTDMLKRESVLC